MHGRHLVVVDLDSMEPVENVAGMIWGAGKLLMTPLEGETEGLFTREHFDPEADYVVVVVRCKSSISFEKREDVPSKIIESERKS